MKKLYEAINTSDILERVQFNPQQFDKVNKFFSHPIEKRFTMLCSVRNAESKEHEDIQQYMNVAEQSGLLGYYPNIMNFQDDQFKGLLICNTMRYAIENSNEVAIHYNPNSEGTKVDMGMALFFRKEMAFVNDTQRLGGAFTEYYPFATPDFYRGDFSSYVNASRQELMSPPWLLRKHQFKLRYNPGAKGEVPKLENLTAIYFGMLFASRCPFAIANLDEAHAQVAKEKTDPNKSSKSYTQVALMLNQIYNP